MRWPVIYYVARFRPWFAWRPVKIDEQYVWLEWIERKVEYHCDRPYEYYRFPPEPSAPTIRSAP